MLVAFALVIGVGGDCKLSKTDKVIAHELKYIPPEIADKIKDIAKLEDIIHDFAELKKSGSSFIGNCPHCHAKKFTYTPSKSIYKCFSGCQKSGLGAIKFLTDVIGKTFPEALIYLADRYNIDLEEEKKPTRRKRGNRKEKFRDRQLKESGILDKDQKYNLAEGQGTLVEHDRYQSASIDKFWNVIPGDDMILHYVDLDFKPIVFKSQKTNRKGSLIRIRWANPSLHKDKNGKPMKYQSPYDSGSHLWLPNYIIKAYKQGEIIETLYICEGEKKADKMCLEGLPAVAVMGINNFASAGEMPRHFEQIVKRCNVVNVVFVLDSDWQDISLKDDTPMRRPRTFFRAVLKFRDYFYAYANEGFELKIFFAYSKDQAFKGIDDLLVRGIEKEDKLSEDFTKAMVDRKGEGKYVNVHNITETSSYQLKEFWHIHSGPAFLKHYKEELKKLREFKLFNLKRRYNPETDEFDLAQKLLPHETFWKVEEWETRSGNTRKKYEFVYRRVLEFLFNRGFGLYEYTKDQFRFIYVNDRIVQETNPHKIQRFVQDFTREIEEEEVLELLLRGGKQYLGPDKLSNMYYRQLEFVEADKDYQYLFFKTCYWKITKDEIIQRPLSDLPMYVWQDKIVDFEPKYIGKSMISFEQQEDTFSFKTTDEFDQSDIAQFYYLTSHFHWKKEQKLVEDDKGIEIVVEREDKEKTTNDDVKLLINNLVSKMIAAGYILHDYLDYGNMKAIVCMDGEESAVGKSQGGTGKSIWGKQFEYLVPEEVIDGKKKNIEDDNHLYENVDERTSVICFDDVRVNFNFEFLFSQITTGVIINPKGEKRFKIKPPKFIVITNHALNGEGNSFNRRQYTISFSDYFNRSRTVADQFGHQLFHEWEFDQWNLFYNFMACCIQTYLRFGLKNTSKEEAIERRKMRQRMGENFLSWASLVFDTDLDHMEEPIGIYLNKKLNKNYLCAKFLERYPNERKYVDPNKLKEKLKLYSEYAGLDYNPTTKGGRIKSNGNEYIILGDDSFDASKAKIAVNNEDDLRKYNSPF